MPPKRPNLVLPTHIPHIELYILVRDGLDVEADGGDGRDVGVELQFVEDGYGAYSVSLGERRQPEWRLRREGRFTGLAGGIQAEHEQAHFP